MTACIVGWAHTAFGRLEGETVESLITRVTRDALADAGIEPADVGEIVLGHFNAGFSAQDFTASLVLQASPDLRFKRATRVENACATGSAAVHQGLQAIAAKSARIALVVGVEQMTTTPGSRHRPQSAQGLLCARGGARSMAASPGIFGQIAGLYFQRYGDQSDALAQIAAKNHRNGVGQSLCADPQGSGLRLLPPARATRIRASPARSSAPTARRSPTAPPRVVLADVETALALRKAVVFRAAEHVQDFLPMSRRDVLKFEGCAQAWAPRARRAPASGSPISPSSRPTTASPSRS